MSTNFYGTKKPSPEQKVRIAQLVLNGELEKAKEEIDSLQLSIHIGKSSGGYKFLFNAQGKTWSSFYEFKQFVKGYHISTEYGHDFSWEEFEKWFEVDQEDISQSEEVPEHFFTIDGYEFSRSDSFS